MKYRAVAAAFLVLTVLAGFAVSGGYIEIAIINAVVFLGLGLLVAVFVAPRFGKNGLVFGMTMAFMVSLIWPFALIAPLLFDSCEGDDCGKVTVLIAPESENSE